MGERWMNINAAVLVVLLVAMSAMAVDQVPAGSSPPSAPAGKYQGAPLKYKFDGKFTPIYRVTIRTDLPTQTETISGTIAYSIKSVDPTNGQVLLDYSKHFQTTRQSKVQENQQRAWPPHPMMPPPMPPMPNPWAQPPAPTDIMIDGFGAVLRDNRSGDDRQLPDLLGPDWQLLIPALSPDGKDAWKSDEQLAMYEKAEQPQNRWPPAPPWQQQQQPAERVERPAHKSVSYTLGEAHGDLVTLGREILIATDEKVGDTPLEQCTGTGTISFDVKSGLVHSLDYSQVVQVTTNNITLKVPTTVSAQLLSDDEVAKMKADAAAATAKAQDTMQRQQSQEAADAQRTMPTAEESAVEIKAVQSKWKPASGTAVEVLPGMHGLCTRQADGLVMLKRGQKIATAESYQPPTTIRAIVLLQEKDMRLSYAADQVIFNWEMNQDELRVDGGPASGQHKPGEGRLPLKRWVGIEWVVHPNETIIYVDGEERFRSTADFSSIDKNFGIEAHAGYVWVKSVQVIH